MTRARASRRMSSKRQPGSGSSDTVSPDGEDERPAAFPEPTSLAKYRVARAARLAELDELAEQLHVKLDYGEEASLRLVPDSYTVTREPS